jgi:hypothetical protein
MKVIIYFILIIAFLMFYQKNPMFAIILIILTGGVYFFFKSRKARGGASSGAFLSGSHDPRSTSSDELVKLMLLHQMISPDSSYPNNYHTYSPALSKHQEKIEKTKQEVLELLES